MSAAGTVLPNGRKITPAGAWFTTAPYPFAVAVRPDGRQLAIPSVGWPFSLNVFNPESGERRLFKLGMRRQLPAGNKNVPEVEVMNGVTYSPDGRLLYVSTGDSGAVDVYDSADWHKVRRLNLNGALNDQAYEQSFSGALVLSPDGKRLFVLDQANWRVVIFDSATGARLRCVATGVDPFALALDADGQRLYVANTGLFEYQPVPGVNTKNLLQTGLRFPPTGYPSREARRGTRAEGHDVPALGEENSERGSSVWTYALDPGDAAPQTTARLRLGSKITGDNVGGAAPMGLAVGKDGVYVSLAHEDTVAVLSLDGARQTGSVALSPFTPETLHDPHAASLRGVMPGGLTLCGDRLYVAEAGINAVATVDTKQLKLLAHTPVGWFPSAIACSADGQSLYVANAKGRGTGANGGAQFHPGGTGSYIGEREFGSLSVLPLPALTKQAPDTEQVIANNVAALQGSKPLPRLGHVFLIVRENRTFDEIFGDLDGADGDPTLARWGLHGWRQDATSDQTLRVTPNAHALAQRFATSDRFFVDSDVSADGHRWVVGAAETPWFQLAWTSNYGGRRSGNSMSKAPGRRALGGGSDAPMPEDEPQFGTLWEHIAGAGLAIRNYGEGLEVEGSEEIAGAEPEGQRLVLNAPVPMPVFASTDRSYPTFNLGIPDQYRYEEFARDFRDLLAKGNVPRLVVIRLPGDHTARPRPLDGYPDTASYVADNDLALGKIVDLVSHSAIWKDTAMLVVEDDAQGGVDHVDAHRSVMLAISPWVRPGIISHRHTSMGSLQKTMYELLGLGPLNLEDALAADLSDMFTDTPALRPFTAVPSDARIFEPARARVARPKGAEQARELLDMDDPEKMEKAAAISHRHASRERKKN